jgi:hypothetical protein
MAIRQSLGASTRHILGDVVVETVLLTLAGGLVGLGISAWGIRLLAVLGASQLPLGAQIAFDGRLALVALLGAMVMGIALAVPIAWFNLHGDPAIALQSESREARPAAQLNACGTASSSPRSLWLSFFWLGRLARAQPELRDGGVSRLPPDHILSGQ